MYMILGYNQPRPSRENYLNFSEKLVSGLEGLNISGLSLMYYGSFVRGDYNPGRSDIDALLEFPDDVVIDKTSMVNCSRVLAYALEGNNIPFQVSVGDRTTHMDGRFNTYTADFGPYFVEEGKMMVGPDPREHMAFNAQKTGTLYNMSFNLRKARFGFLMSEHTRKADYECMLKDFGKALDSISRGSKQIAGFIDGVERRNRFSGLESIKRNLPSVDSVPLDRIQHLYSNLDELDALYHSPDELMSLWESSLTTFEQLVKEYLLRVPND